MCLPMLKLPLINIPIRVPLIPHSTALVPLPTPFVESPMGVQHDPIPIPHFDPVDRFEDTFVDSFIKVLFNIEIFIVKDRAEYEHL